MEEGIPLYKIAFIGDQYVGKSSIINRFLNDTFKEEYKSTIGLDFQSKKVDINATNIKVILLIENNPTILNAFLSDFFMVS